MPLDETLLRRAWAMEWSHLESVQFPWQHAKGPMSATQAVLMELGWSCAEYDQWTDPKGTKWSLDFHDPALKAEVQTVFELSLKSYSNHVIRTQPGNEFLRDGVDASREDFPLALVLWQGALNKDNSVHKLCPFCPSVELSLLHMMHECPKVAEAHGATPEAWKPCVAQRDQEHFWTKGLVRAQRTAKQQLCTDPSLCGGRSVFS